MGDSRIREAHLLEQLDCVINHEPLWPGNTLSHELAYELEKRGLIRRLRETGEWVSTTAGRKAWAAEKDGHDGD